jgi:extradiol dioxygenase family protein
MYSKLNGLNLELATRATFIKNTSGEHLSFFIKGPYGYMLEFKSLKEPKQVFSV